jgi:hypothetical protein
VNERTDGAPPPNEPEKDTTTRDKWIAGTLISVISLAVIVSFFVMNVCEDQLTNAGDVIEVCRNLQASDPPIIVGGAIAVALLGVFFTEISGLGFSFKRETRAALRAVKEQVDAAEEKASAATGKTQRLEEDMADVHDGLGHMALSVVSGPQEPTPFIGDNVVSRLASRYNELRWTMPSGTARTREMELLFRQMEEELRDTEDVDVRLLLSSKDRGLRLAGIAYLSSNAKPEFIPDLAATALEEDKPFGEYCAWRTLRRRLQGHCHLLVPEVRQRMTGRLGELSSTSDRSLEIRGILRDCPPRPDT